MSRFHLAGLVFVTLISLTSSLFSGTAGSDELIQSAWQSLQAANASKAEDFFKQAISADAKNARAYIGISYLYSWQHRYKAAWDEFTKALRCAEDPNALIYATMASTMSQRNSSAENFNTEKLYRDLLIKADAQGILRAMAYSRLADHERFSDQVESSKKVYDKLNAITAWALIGPFENQSGSGFNKVYAPETGIDLNAEYPARFGSYAKWFVPQNPRLDKWIDFERHFISSDGVFYAYTFVFSPTKQSVSFRIGTSGAFKAMLNDEVVLQCEEEYNNDLDTYICETELQSGWNKVLIKIAAWDISRRTSTSSG